MKNAGSELVDLLSEIEGAKREKSRAERVLGEKRNEVQFVVDAEREKTQIVQDELTRIKNEVQRTESSENVKRALF